MSYKLIFLYLAASFVYLVFVPQLSASPTSDTSGGNQSLKSFGDSNEPTYIKSNQLRLNSKERVFIYTGNVEVLNGDLTILSDVLEGNYDEGNQIKDLTAKGNVYITKGEDIKASGEKAIYLAESETIVLTENPELLKEGSVLSADKITIYIKEDRSVAEGQVRVKLVQDTKSKPTK